MDVIGFVTAPLRGLLGSIEEQAEEAFPVQGLEEVQEGILDTEQAIRKATESIAAHVAVLETLAASLPQLTGAVEGLSEQLATITTVLAPVAGAERRVAGLEHLFSRAPRHTPPGEATPPGETPGE